MWFKWCSINEQPPSILHFIFTVILVIKRLTKSDLLVLLGGFWEVVKRKSYCWERCWNIIPLQLDSPELIYHLVCCVDWTKAQRDQGQKCSPALDLWLSWWPFRGELLLVCLQLLVLSCSESQNSVINITSSRVWGEKTETKPKADYSCRNIQLFSCENLQTVGKSWAYGSFGMCKTAAFREWKEHLK